MKFEYKISDWKSFKKGYLSHKNLLSGSKIEYQELVDGKVNISTKEHEFNNWHLAEFGRFYGANIFRNNNVLELVEIEEINFQFNKPEKSQSIFIKNKWNKSIEFKTFYLNCAEAFSTNVLANSLSESGIEQLNRKYPELKLENDTYKHSYNYAYQIIDEILLVIAYNRDSKKGTIENLFKTEWHEK